jgi:large subunit ribosomal protein L13
VRTYSPKASEIQRDWYVIDADGLVLGRLCTEIARVLRGKHKPIFAPHKVVLTSGKADRKEVYRHSQYPGGLTRETYANLLARKPADAIRKSVWGMLPKGPLGRQQLRKLKVYAGAEHPHAAQQPKVLEVTHAQARV